MENHHSKSEQVHLTPLDHIVLQNGGHTSNTERLPIFLQKSKFDKPPGFGDLQYQIGRLRQEIAWYQEGHESLMGLFFETRDNYRDLRNCLKDMEHQSENARDQTVVFKKNIEYVSDMIQRSLQRVSHRLSTSENRLLQSLGIDLDDTVEQDIVVV